MDNFWFAIIFYRIYSKVTLMSHFSKTVWILHGKSGGGGDFFFSNLEDDRGCQNGLVLRKNVMEIPTIDHKMTRSLIFFWCWNCFDPNTVLPRLVRRRTIKLMSFLIKKDH